jgi:hypothetical protein
MADNVDKLRPDALAKELREWLLDCCALDNRSKVIIDEMERRLLEVDNCVCWGVDCVHQAKELDKSYSLYSAAAEAQKILDNPNNYNHAPNLRAALTALVERVKRAEQAGKPHEEAQRRR